MEKENVREARVEIQLPESYPLGNKKFWDFKTFPKVQKAWS